MFCDSLDLVHALDSGISLILVREAHEAEATAASGVTILDDNLEFDVSIGGNSVVLNARKSYSFLDGAELLEL
mgnify:CR=1 FL=1